jgi:hypothetical protein
MPPFGWTHQRTSIGRWRQWADACRATSLNVGFRPSRGVATNVAWEPVIENGDVVTGLLVLCAAVSDGEIVTRAVVTVDQASLTRPCAATRLKGPGGT